MSLKERLHALDRFQQRRPRLGFALAVLKKLSDDGAGRLAALISYYAFVSLFPLLLVFVTILGFVLEGDPDTKGELEAGALSHFPIIGDQLKLHSLSGSGLALAIGLLGALLAGMGVTNAAQYAFDKIWAVPPARRDGFLRERLRGLGTLGILGVLTIVSTLAANLLGSGLLGTLGGVAAAFAFNLILFTTVFRLLTSAHMSLRELLPGILLAAVLWALLQYLGGYYVAHVLKRMEPLYGTFALVLGLLAWLYLGAQLVLLAAALNVVRVRRLWPRSLLGDPE
jgi:membrane protein